jgi:8-oxo-dGTP pyrophosphatase MutT (NUDIX family)
MVTYIDLVNEGDAFPYHRDASKGFFHFRIAGLPSTLGYVLSTVAEAFRYLPGWAVNDAEAILELENFNSVSERTRVVKKSLLELRQRGTFSILRGWRNETFPVYGPNNEVLLHIERCACPLFGVVTYGVHAVGYVLPEDPTMPLKIWVSRRAQSKPTFAGMLDSTAAGGIASEETPLEAVVRECEEEASLFPTLVQQNLQSVGVITHFYVREERSGGEIGLLQPECQYIFGLPLPGNVKCKPNDDEADHFQLLSLEEVQMALKRGAFKPNSALVLLKFFIHHGILTAGNEKDYNEILDRLHRHLEFPIRSNKSSLTENGC